MTRQEVVAGDASGRAPWRERGGREHGGREHGAILPLRALAVAAPARAGAGTGAEAGPVAERMLLDAAERALRRGATAEALVLRLARLPRAKPHHRLVARCLLDEAALRGGGQVFALRNLDLVLLGPPAEATRSLLAGLFGGGVVQALAPGAALLAYARERAAEHPAPPRRAPDPPPLEAAAALLRHAPAGELLQAQVAAELLPGGALRPLFREALPRPLAADPACWHDLALPLGTRTLAIAGTSIAEGGPLSGGRGLALHLNLALATVLAPDFARFAETAAAHGTRAGVEIALVEAFADPAAFERASRIVRAAGFTLALDGVGHQALLLTHPGRLGTDLVKVEWSDGLAAADPGAEAALREIGPARVVLAGADGEAAMRWGFARGVRRFQGRHVDAALAATRLGACPAAAGCTLRLCAGRGAAADAAGRTGCRNQALLDAAAA